MEKLDIQIADEMRRVTGAKQRRRFAVMSGVVTAADTDDDTCTVQLTADADGVPTDGILLNVVTENTNGMYMLPAVDAHCVVAEVDGPGQLKQLLWASEYTEVKLTVGSSQFSVVDGTVKAQVGGSTKLTMTDGQVVAQAGAQTKLTMTGSGHKIEANGKDLKDVLGDLVQHIMALTVTTGVGPSGTPINFADFVSDAAAINEVLV